MSTIREKWENLSPDHKKLAAVAGAGALLAPVILTFMFSGEAAITKAAVSDKPIADPLIGAKTSDMGINALSAKIYKVEKQSLSSATLIVERLSRIEAALDVADDRNHKAEYKLKAVIRRATAEIENSKNDVQSLLQNYDNRMNQLKLDLEAKISAIEAREPQYITLPQNNSGDARGGGDDDVLTIDTRRSSPTQQDEAIIDDHLRSNTQLRNNAPAVVEDDWEMFQGAVIDVPVVDTEGRSGVPDQAPPITSIRTYGAPHAGEDFGDTPIVEEDKPEDIFMPAGSIFTGTLLNGLAAPTGKTAQSELTPVLMRVKRDAILPNNNSLDIKECFLIAGGYGSLSTERAYIRAEILTCIREDGGVIEVPLDAYAIGNDGLTGMRGKFVSKQGRYLSNALKAGALNGIAKALSPVEQRSVNISTNKDEFVPYEFPEVGGVASYAAGNAASETMERLADFFMEMAESTFPVIEVKAGREVTFVTKKGIKLSLVN
jgi:conjugal transfer pilus assembly protein TraB